jgi:acetoin utilization deacetylase AcuC-like enzyme
MEVVYVSHPVFARHDTGRWHPERAERLEAAERGVLSSGLRVTRLEPPPVERSALERVHDSSYIDAIQRFCAAGGGALDPDTVAVPASWEAALRAAGAGPEAVGALRARSSPATAFLAVRPPGHHALRNRAMGFCLFNNVAVTASWLQAGGERVAIVDWDVHHGNGTQEMLGSAPGLLYLSIHQHPFYPFAGTLEENGAGAKSVVNVPVPAGTGGDVYRAVFERLVVPVLLQFSPDWLLVSAGYDAHEEDPLAELRLVASDYAFMAARLGEAVSPNRTIVFLEGGYHLPAITTSVAETLRGLAGLVDHPEPARRSPAEAWAMAEAAVRSAGRHWGVR